MGTIGTKLRSTTSDNGRKQIMHWCPGCDGPHGIQIAGPSGPTWQFDGNYDRPTFSPSILCFTSDPDEPGSRETLCHYFIRGGRIEFCGDSPHKLAGQTVDLPDWPYAVGEYGGLDEGQ